MFEKLKNFVLGFFKREYEMELLEEPIPMIDTLSVNKLYNELRNIPYHNIRFGITEYKVEKVYNPPMELLRRLDKNRISESFTKISREEVMSTNQRSFFIENFIFVYGIDDNIWKVTLNGCITGYIKNATFDGMIVNSFIQYCNDVLKRYGLERFLWSDCKISFLEDRSKVYNRHINGYTIIDSSNMIWTEGTVTESVIMAYSDINLYEDLGIERIAPDIEKNRAREIPIDFSDRTAVFTETLQRFVEESKNYESMLADVHV